MSSIADAWLDGLTLLGAIWFIAISLLGRRVRHALSIEATGVCGGCGYSLSGLPASSRCPECGRESPEKLLVRRRTWGEWRFSRAWLLLPLTPLVLVIPLLLPAAWYCAFQLHDRWSHAASDWAQDWGFESADAIKASLVAMALGAPLVVYLLRTERRAMRCWGIAGAHFGAIAGLFLGTWVLCDSREWEMGAAGAFAALGMFVGAIAGALVRRAIGR
ncbi:MAG: hypothetical protein ACKVU4_05165 [Phycisphaerales bacterium]